jgi:hypothetical protein
VHHLQASDCSSHDADLYAQACRVGVLGLRRKGLAVREGALSKQRERTSSAHLRSSSADLVQVLQVREDLLQDLHCFCA